MKTRRYLRRGYARRYDDMIYTFLSADQLYFRCIHPHVDRAASSSPSSGTAATRTCPPRTPVFAYAPVTAPETVATNAAGDGGDGGGIAHRANAYGRRVDCVDVHASEPPSAPIASANAPTPPLPPDSAVAATHWWLSTRSVASALTAVPCLRSRPRHARQPPRAPVTQRARRGATARDEASPAQSLLVWDSQYPGSALARGPPMSSIQPIRPHAQRGVERGSGMCGSLPARTARISSPT